MNAQLLIDKRYPAGWVFNFAPLQAGEIVPIVPATNIPDKGCYWINTDILKDDAYGILLYPGEFKIVE